MTATSLFQPLIERLDEALRIIEVRRYGRVLRSGRLPMVFALCTFVTAWVLASTLSGVYGTALLGRAGGFYGVLLGVSGVAAALGGFLRAQQLWQNERQLRTFSALLMTRTPPRQFVLTSVVMCALLGLGLAAIPAVFGVLLALLARANPAGLLLHVALLPGCALLGSALGVSVFFISVNLVPARLYYPALALLALIALGLWGRIEMIESVRRKAWEEHPGRITRALTLLTPVPATLAISSPRWFDRFAGQGLAWGGPTWTFALAYLGGALAVTGLAAFVSVRGYQRLAMDVEHLDEKPRAPTEDPGQEVYWKGFRNPVWTREVRTRLRSKDTAEFIFFSSIAVAAGAFVPLLMTASDLSDPLQTAQSARSVFFWLTMTLVALITLLAPGLTADVITRERATGTLEMLVGTPLKPRDILMGKLLGAAGVLLLLISPSLPLFGLCYLFHGADGRQVVQVYMLLLLTLFACTYIGVMQSAIHAKGGWAKMWTHAITALFVALPGGPFWIAAAVAGPQASMRNDLMNQGVWVAFMAVIWGFVLALFWGNANEQLEYSEY